MQDEPMSRHLLFHFPAVARWFDQYNLRRSLCPAAAPRLTKRSVVDERTLTRALAKWLVPSMTHFKANYR